MKPLYMIAAAVFTAVATFGGNHVLAQQYPSKTLRMVVPNPPGGTTDFVGRVIAAKLSDLMGQTIVVENKAGAAQVIGTVAVAQAQPDGYTILLAAPEFTLNPSLQSKPPYDPLKDFEPVALVANYPHVIVGSTAVAATSAKELIDLAKAKPDELHFASGGSGSSNHVSAEWFMYSAGIRMTHVPYKGNGPAITDLLADRVQILFTSISPVEQHIKAGKLKAIAVTGSKRLASLPNVPTVSEVGIPGYDFTVWYGFFVPAGTPRTIVDRLNADLVRTMQSPEVREKLAPMGADLTVSTPDGFGTLLRDELVRWTKLAKETGLKVD
jgi:tripartite-type tricarboxylate transporter receptor subunit TctC